MNMEYCRFRNTLKDLLDCLDAINDDLGLEEDAARKKMIKVCKDIIYDSGLDEDEEDD